MRIHVTLPRRPASADPPRVAHAFRRPSAFWALFLTTIVVLSARSLHSLSDPQFWAEGGQVFFAEQFGHAWPMLHVEYAGYLHTVSRLTAWVASAFPPSEAPGVYAVSWLLVSSASVAYTADRLRHFVPVGIVIAAFVLSPTSGEVFGNISNAQWFVQFALVAACLVPRAERGGWREVFASIVVFAMATQGPFSPIIAFTMLPLFAWRWVGRSGSASRGGGFGEFASTLPSGRYAALVAGALVQVGFIAFATARPIQDNGGLANLFSFAFGDALPVHLFGSNYLVAWGWQMVFVLLLGTVVVSRALSIRTKIVAAVFVVLSCAQIVLACASQPQANFAHLYSGDRYFLQAKVVFWWVLYLALVGNRGMRKHEASGVVLVAIVLFALINVADLQRKPMVDLDWAQSSQVLDRPGHHSIRINPVPWTIEVDTPEKGAVSAEAAPQAR